MVGMMMISHFLRCWRGGWGGRRQAIVIYAHKVITCAPKRQELDVLKTALVRPLLCLWHYFFKKRTNELESVERRNAYPRAESCTDRNVFVLLKCVLCALCVPRLQCDHISPSCPPSPQHRSPVTPPPNHASPACRRPYVPAPARRHRRLEQHRGKLEVSMIRTLTAATTPLMHPPTLPHPIPPPTHAGRTTGRHDGEAHGRVLRPILRPRRRQEGRHRGLPGSFPSGTEPYGCERHQLCRVPVHALWPPFLQG